MMEPHAFIGGPGFNEYGLAAVKYLPAVKLWTWNLNLRWRDG
jgi:hypothetical protein